MPCFNNCHQVLRSVDVDSQELGLTNLFIVFLHISLNLNFGLPLALAPLVSSPKRISLGKRLSLILLTLPSHRSLLLLRIAVRLGMPLLIGHQHLKLYLAT